MLPKLNFPEYPLRLRRVKNVLQIFDIIRKKFVVLSPEEWVRQHIVWHLVHEASYPAAFFMVEKGLKLNSTQKRSDVLVCAPDGSPFLLVECKAPEVKIDQITLEQSLRYNLTYKAPYLLLTNGLKTICLDAERSLVCDLPAYPKSPAK